MNTLCVLNTIHKPHANLIVKKFQKISENIQKIKKKLKNKKGKNNRTIKDNLNWNNEMKSKSIKNVSTNKRNDIMTISVTTTTKTTTIMIIIIIIVIIIIIYVRFTRVYFNIFLICFDFFCCCCCFFIIFIYFLIFFKCKWFFDIYYSINALSIAWTDCFYSPILVKFSFFLKRKSIMLKQLQKKYDLQADVYFFCLIVNSFTFY